ncbi:bacillithiol biosynthesis deacetylase BshB2 [Bacillus sp. FJAT-44921]|uniref:bacillithiol biosynthesis deacetylase BshB2 n=1 Tax=Alkalihalobacterium alkalicellulosilyticum TaxID=1912214 RepID=UPI00099607D8
MEKHVLVILPHPDDESFSSAGTILKHKQNGTPVTYVCMTLGEMGRNFGNPPIATRESLPSIRKKEMEEAAQILQIDDLRFLGLHDKTIEFEDFDKVASSIKEILVELKPSLVITFYPGYAIHPDHDACGEIVMKAVSLLPKKERPVVHAIAITNNSVADLGKPDIVYEISEFINQKLLALKAHTTQMQEVAAVAEQKLKEGLETEEWIRYERFWIYDVDKNK